jgi:AcrR family transcriptional regulator
MRRDARDNREAILDAARELFADSADVAMSQVARHAGVGQATLYRNFPNRGALTAEILDEHVARMAALAAAQAGEPDAFYVLLRNLIDSMVNI